MTLNLGRIGNCLSDRYIVEEEREDGCVLSDTNSCSDWGTRIISWISAPSYYTEENQRAIDVFQKAVRSHIGEQRLRRIEKRYGIDFDKMRESGSPLLSCDVAKICTGIRVVNVEDIEELIQKAGEEENQWPRGMDRELRESLRGVQNSEELDRETFYLVFFELQNSFASEALFPDFCRPLHGGAPSELLARLFFDQFLTDRERLFLCEGNAESNFETFVYDFSARIIHRELDVGMVIEAPGDRVFYRVAAKIISGEGLVSYCLVPATLDTELPPIRFYRGTSARPYAIDAISSLITDLETDIGERAFRSDEYDSILREEFPPFKVQAGHSLGATILSKKLVEDLTIRTAYLFNGTGIRREEVDRFNERIAEDPDPVHLIIRDACADTVCRVGQCHIGYGAPEEIVDYLRYGSTLEMQEQGAGYAHTMVWNRETRYYGIEGMDPNVALDRENGEGSKECLRSILGPIVAKILLIVRAIIRWLFGSRAEKQKGIQIGRFIEGRWKVDHLRPQANLL